MRHATLILLALAVILPALAEVMPARPDDPVARGEYIVNKASMCVQCHSPRDRAGDIIAGQQLTGGAIPFTSPFQQGPKWGFQAPSIKGLVGWTEEEAVRLLTSGKRRNGETPRAPMPPFRMSREDAQAAVAYLKSL